MLFTTLQRNCTCAVFETPRLLRLFLACDCVGCRWLLCTLARDTEHAVLSRAQVQRNGSSLFCFQPCCSTSCAVCPPIHDPFPSCSHLGGRLLPHRLSASLCSPLQLAAPPCTPYSSTSASGPPYSLAPSLGSQGGARRGSHCSSALDCR